MAGEEESVREDEEVVAEVLLKAEEVEHDAEDVSQSLKTTTTTVNDHKNLMRTNLSTDAHAWHRG